MEQMKDIQMSGQSGAKQAPLSLYVHIPFCAEKCLYCDFLSFPMRDKSTQDTYIEALCKEIKRIKENRPLDTVFWGGGTPSILSGEHIERLMQCISGSFMISENAEMTIEANPGTLDRQKAALYRQLGFNRISFGVQAFQDELLRAIGRIHTAEQAQKSVVEAQEEGFFNVNIDLMIGLPGQSTSMLQDAIQRAVDLEVSHISVYDLILEEGTPLYDRVMREEVELPREDEIAQMLDLAEDMLHIYGFEQYELSNFARPGFECRHNMAYWKLNDYIGVGVGSSGCMRKKEGLLRSKNTDSLTDYIRKIERGESVCQSKEWIARQEQIFERIMLGLRMNQGITWQEMQMRFGCDLHKDYRGAIEKNRHAGLLICTPEGMALTRLGRRLQNRVLLDFMNDV